VTEGEHRWLGCERREDHRDDDGNVVHAELVDSLYERVRAASGDIALEITDTDHGSRDFTARDPEGNLWAFGTYRPRVGDD
jgi:uncharacterized glyoxalase superfamily protein PhnB